MIRDEEWAGIDYIGMKWIDHWWRYVIKIFLHSVKQIYLNFISEVILSVRLFFYTYVHIVVGEL